MGPPTILSKEEEERIVQWMFTRAKVGFPVTKNNLLDSVSNFLKKIQRPNPFTQGVPERSWFESFLKRHPNISVRMAQNLTSSRANVTKENLIHWSSEVQHYLQDNNLMEIFEEPSRVFNADEAAFFLNPKGSKVLVPRGFKSVYKIVNPDEKECLTVLMNGNADGTIAPPLILFSYVRVPQDIAKSIPSHWGVGVSENGWMTCECFYEYMTNVFYPWIVQQGIKLPILFFVDGHVSHSSIHLSNFCDDVGIILVCLFPNATHLHQPMDIFVFKTLKESWKAAVANWRNDNPGQLFKKKDFAPLLQQAINSSISPDVLRNGFRKSGLCPWNIHNIDFDLIPKVPESNENETVES